MLIEETKKAIYQFKMALASYPENVEYNFKYAKAVFLINDNEESIAHYKKVISLEEENDIKSNKTEQSYMALGQIYEEKLKDKRRATRAYKKLIESFPDNDLARA